MKTPTNWNKNRMKKQVLLYAPECIGHTRYKNEGIPWSDTYISFKTKPGRKTQYYGPTLISYTTLVDDIKNEKEFLINHPKWTEKTTKSIHQLEQIKRLLETGFQCYIENNDDNKKLPIIYSNRPAITRKIAEELVICFMNSLGYYRLNLKWKKPKDEFFITPVSF